MNSRSTSLPAESRKIWRHSVTLRAIDRFAAVFRLLLSTRYAVRRFQPIMTRQL